jgi:ABC-type uncharacterized transport system, auxiliary component
MKKTLILFLVAATALICASCVKLGSKPVDKHFYRIAPVRQAGPTPPPTDIVLSVRRLTVSDLYNTREIIYQMADGRMESDFYNLYFITPGSMLSSELRKWLTASGRFSHVIAPGSMVVPTLTLEGVVNTFYGDYSGGQASAVVDMQFFLIDESTPDNDVLFSKNYTQRVPLSQPDPQQLVTALTQGVQAIFTQLESDLAEAPLKR